MTPSLPAHPDRRARTLAVRAREPGPFAVPLPGSADARVPLGLLAARARHALDTRGTDAARARLADLDSPDLWAGTVQDGTARGFAVALEEALSLCEPAPAPPPPIEGEPITGKQLRRRREIVVSSSGARVRFSRKGGITVIDRPKGIATPDCIRFEDRADGGDLDGFAPVDGDRPRLFSPGFLVAQELVEAESGTMLRLAGRLGRRPNGFPCELVLEARTDADWVRMVVRVRNEQRDHRLRIRFAKGVDAAVRHRGTPAWERVLARGAEFSTATIVRACGRLRVDDEVVAVPDAQCIGWIEHEFALGGERELDGWISARQPAD